MNLYVLWTKHEGRTGRIGSLIKQRDDDGNENTTKQWD